MHGSLPFPLEVTVCPRLLWTGARQGVASFQILSFNMCLREPPSLHHSGKLQSDSIHGTFLLPVRSRAQGVQLSRNRAGDVPRIDRRAVAPLNRPVLRHAAWRVLMLALTGVATGELYEPSWRRSEGCVEARGGALPPLIPRPIWMDRWWQHYIARRLQGIRLYPSGVEARADVLCAAADGLTVPHEQALLSPAARPLHECLG